MDRRQYLQYTASTLAAGAGLPLAGCQDTNAAGAALRSLATRNGWLTVADLGWKDTLMVWPGETLRIAAYFRQALPGGQLFLFHCHHLEHEDADMMVNYRMPA